MRPKTATARRRLAWAFLAAVFALLLAVSWQQWANLLIDSGREMNTPLRLLRAERLYSDVYYLYGPLAPYLNAALYAIFGTHLNTLYAAGAAAAIVLLVLVFRLAEKLTGTWEALLAAWAVTVLCVFKQGGNYVVPYAYAAVYGTLLGLGSLVAQVRYVHRPQSRQAQGRQSLLLAGLLAGLALICKLEFGFAATASLIAVAMSEKPGDRVRVLARGLAPAFIIPLATYGLMLSVMSSDAVLKDTFLWPPHIPAELIYFNRSKLGLFDPWKTIRELLSAVALVGLIGVTIVVAAAVRATSSFRAGFARLPPAARRAVVWAGAASVLGLLVNIAIFHTRRDVSPLRALPVLCVAAICAYGRHLAGGKEAETARRSGFVVSVYALFVLGRVILRVPSGGAYGAYLLPVPLVLFTHLATTYYRPAFDGLPAYALRARRIVLALFAAVLSAATIVIAYRYIEDESARLETPRGVVKVSQEVAAAFGDALALIAETTQPDDYIWAVPEGSSLNFLSGRRAPLRYEILTPGFLDAAGERRAIQQLEARDVKLVFILDRPMTEFRCAAFGRDCYRILMEWIDGRYDAFAEFGRGPHGPLITAYRPKEP